MVLSLFGWHGTLLARTALLTAVVVQASAINEAAGEESLAHLTAEMMREGAGSKDAKRLAEEASSMGGSLAVNTSTDATTVRMGVLSEFAPQALRMLADVVQRPALPAAEFPRVKASFLRNMAVGRSRAMFPAENALARAELSQLLALVQLYKSLGGGWNLDNPQFTSGR